jgi:hypothetical protein
VQNQGVNAFDYMVLGRMIHFFIPSGRLFSIPAPTIAAVFVALDFVAFVIQLVGGSMAGPTAPAEEKLKAIHIYMGGIGLQQFFILGFVILAIRFQLDMRKVQMAQRSKPGWRRLLFTLYASLSFISVRLPHPIYLSYVYRSLIFLMPLFRFVSYFD